MWFRTGRPLRFVFFNSQGRFQCFGLTATKTHICLSVHQFICPSVHPFASLRLLPLSNSPAVGFSAMSEARAATSSLPLKARRGRARSRFRCSLAVRAGRGDRVACKGRVPGRDGADMMSHDVSPLLHSSFFILFLLWAFFG